MARENLNDLRTFVVVAREGSFTRAAARLGVSPSAVSHTMRGLEESLGMRLVTRTTRSVALTTAGEQVLAIFAPRLDEIEAELSVLREQRDKPAGNIRITATDFSADGVQGCLECDRPARSARAAACTRPETPSLRKILLT